MQRTITAIAAIIILLSVSGCKTETGPLENVPKSADISPEEEINVNNISVVSPDGKYRAESYGINYGVTSGGLYAAEGIRISDTATNKVLWQMDGYYNTKFLWSENSRYLAVTYTAAIYADTVVIDIEDFSEHPLPIPDEMLDDMRDYRPDPYFEASEWVDDETIAITYRWVGKDEMDYLGSFVFKPSTNEISDITLDKTEPRG